MRMGDRIRKARTDRGMTQAEVARIAGITQGTLSLIETGHTQEIKAATLLGLTRALTLSPAQLRTGKEMPMESDSLSEEEAEALYLARMLSHSARVGWLAAGRAMLDDEEPGAERGHRHPKPSPKRPN